MGASQLLHDLCILLPSVRIERYQLAPGVAFHHHDGGLGADAQGPVFGIIKSVNGLWSPWLGIGEIQRLRVRSLRRGADDLPILRPIVCGDAGSVIPKGDVG
jgi:hypothetical protein